MRKAPLLVQLTVNIFWLLQVQGQDKGVAVESATPTWSSQLGQQVALLIGIDKYQHVTPLPNCVFDCKAIGKVLSENYGFARITEIYDEAATEEGILGALKDLAGSLTDQQSLLIFFSGHGTKEDLTGDAFWVPVNGKTEADFIPSDRIQRYVKAMKARHVWLVCDSCFSGRLFAEKGLEGIPSMGDLDRYAQEALNKKSRLILSSGGDEPVTSDGFEGHSVFAHYFLEALKSPPRGWTDSSQIFNQIKVDIARNAKQSPQLGAIYETDHRGGEFVLVARRRPEGTVTGTLVDEQTGKPLRGARVWLIGSEEQDKSTIRGFFQLKVLAGVYEGLAIERSGEEGLFEIRAEVDVKNGGRLDLEEVVVPSKMVPTPTPLGPQPGQEQVFKLPNGEELVMVYIPGGIFWMGTDEKNIDSLLRWSKQHSPDPKRESFEDEIPRHQVTVKGFWMGKYEVTNAQYKSFDVSHDSGTSQTTSLGISLNQDKQPVVNVSWDDSQRYTEWLSQNVGSGFRLPIEEEWEYACRAGSDGRFFWGESDQDMKHYANVADQTLKDRVTGVKDYGLWEDGFAETAPVGSFRPNAFGLHDMLGNVWEWCQDWYDAYPGNTLTNESFGGKYRVTRGGSWNNTPVDSHCSDRSGSHPTIRRNRMGFRLARTP